MSEDVNEKEIEKAVLEGLVVLDEANHSAVVTFDSQ